MYFICKKETLVKGNFFIARWIVSSRKSCELIVNKMCGNNIHK